jgi:hypothetical protein
MVANAVVSVVGWALLLLQSLAGSLHLADEMPG